MKNLTYIFFLIGLFSFSQEKKWSLEANYPVPFDNNFVGQNFLGIFDAGAKYRFSDTEILSFGAGVNAGIMKFENEDDFEYYLLFNYYVQPKFFAELNINRLPEFRPFAYAGYSFMIFRSDGVNYTNDLYYTSETLSGFNIGMGLVYDISDNFFIQMQYDFSKLTASSRRNSYTSNVNILKFGIGIRL